MINSELMSDIHNPIKRLITSNMNVLIDPFFNSYKKTDIFLNELQVNLENSFLDNFFISRETLKNYSYNREIRDQSIFIRKPIKKNKIADIIIQKSHSKIIYSINSGSFLELLAYIGGIWSFSFLFLSTILNSYSKHQFFIQLGNRIFDFNCKQNNESNIENIRPRVSETEDETLKQKIERFLRRSYKLHVSFFESLKFMCFRPAIKNEKLRYVKKNEEVISQQLDICSILRKMQEVEKIKNLLFSEEQMAIFNFSPKTLINLDMKASVINMTKDNQKLKNLKECDTSDYLILAWDLFNSKNFDPLERKFNEKLRKLLGNEILEILNNKEKTITRREIIDRKDIQLTLIQKNSIKEATQINLEDETKKLKANEIIDIVINKDKK